MRMTMSKDYYSILCLPRNATDLDINKAYRNLSLLWHPTKEVSNRAQAESNFQQISEAFQVLSNRHYRKFYDRYGKEGLMEDRLVGLDFNGFLPHCTEFPFRDPVDVYLEFFGGRDPLQRLASGDNNGPLSIYDEHCFEHSFPGFPRPSGTKNTEDLSISQKNSPYLYAGSMFSGPTDEGDFMSVCRTKQIINGKHIVTNREVLNDQEKVRVEEDGVLISQTINGQLQSV